MLKKQFGQTIILGVICTIVAAFIIMAAIKIFVGYDDVSLNVYRIFLTGDRHFYWLQPFVVPIYFHLWVN
jgi:hypothetical protein